MTIDQEELNRSFSWYCIVCQERRSGIATNHTALNHIEEYPTHIVIGTGMMTYRFAVGVPPGRPIEDVHLPMSVLHDPADRYYAGDGGTGESLE